MKAVGEELLRLLCLSPLLVVLAFCLGIDLGALIALVT